MHDKQPESRQGRIVYCIGTSHPSWYRLSSSPLDRPMSISARKKCLVRPQAAQAQNESQIINTCGIILRNPQTTANRKDLHGNSGNSGKKEIA